MTALVIPPAMPRTATLRGNTIYFYAIIVRQFRQQILPPGLPMTTVWSYGSLSQKGTVNYPAFTVEARADRPVRVVWVNGPVDSNGRYLRHLLPLDPTLHWTNPPRRCCGTRLASNLRVDAATAHGADPHRHAPARWLQLGRGLRPYRII